VKVLDPGHRYALAHLDGEGKSTLTFVKRVGDKYPGNSSAYEGVTTQEVLRALIERQRYVDGQRPDVANQRVIRNLLEALAELEIRAANARGDSNAFDQLATMDLDAVLALPTCTTCGHVLCRIVHVKQHG